MLRLKYIGRTVYYPVTSFSTISDTVVEVTGTDLPFFNTGFEIYNDSHQLIGRYEAYTTQYRKVTDGFQYSSNGSIWIPTITFTSNGGTLEGTLIQHVTDYKFVTRPKTINTDKWVFREWTPMIPLEGLVTEDATYTAIFDYIEDSLEKRVSNLETEVTELTPYTASQKAYLGDTSVTFTGVTGTNLTVYAKTDSGNAIYTTSVLVDNTVTVSFDALTEAATITISLI